MKSLLFALSVFAGGTLMALTEREKALCDVASCTARGDLKRLGLAFEMAYVAGWTTCELKEAATQLYAYCGFPRALNALEVLFRLAPEAERAPAAGNPSRPDGDSLARGATNQVRLCGHEATGALFDWCPAIDDYLKAHLFGDVFGRDILDWRTREIVTVAALAALENVKPQLDAHVGIARQNGVTDAEIAEILAIARTEETVSAFKAGFPNTRHRKRFSGRSWLAALTWHGKETGVPIHNVTFEPGCRSVWHAHARGQVLVCVGGEGWYQARGKKAVKMTPGTVVEVPSNVAHWHGAGPKSWFSHLAIECHPETNRTTWLEPVSDAEYAETATE